jgi:AcrR family transcriptional regulator
MPQDAWHLPNGNTGARDSREAVLNAAGELFNRDGLRGVGIDTIVARAGVSKATVYRHFRSRDELVIAVLRRRLDDTRGSMDELAANADATPTSRLLRVFELLEEWCARPAFRGSVFTTAAAEFSDPKHPAWRLIQEHSQYVEGWLREQLALAGASDPAGVARRLVILVQGAVGAALLHGDPSFAQDAHAMAAEYLSLVEAAQPPDAASRAL